MMKFRHYYMWFTSRSYRVHYVVGRRLSANRLYWRIAETLLRYSIDVETLKFLRGTLRPRARRVVDRIIAEKEGKQE